MLRSPCILLHTQTQRLMRRRRGAAGGETWRLVGCEERNKKRGGMGRRWVDLLKFGDQRWNFRGLVFEPPTFYWTGGDHRWRRLSFVIPYKVKLQIEDQERHRSVEVRYPCHHLHLHRLPNHPCHPPHRCQSSSRRNRYRILRLRRSLLPQVASRGRILPRRTWPSRWSGAIREGGPIIYLVVLVDHIVEI